MKPTTLIEQFLATAAGRPDATALSWRGASAFETCTFGELESLSARMAAALTDRVRPGDIVPVLGIRRPGTVAAMLACMRCGAAPTYLNPRLRLDQINFTADLTRAPLALVHSAFLAVLGRTVSLGGDRLRLPAVAVTDGASTLPATEQSALDRLSAVCEASLLALPKGSPSVPDRLPAAGDRGFCLFTSGSTGMPKGVLVGQGDLLARARAEIQWFGLGPEDVLLNVLPFSFDVGLNQLCTALTVGCEICMSDSWTPADLQSAVRARRVTGVSGVPSIWRDVMAAGIDFTGIGGPLRYVTVSGGDLPVEELLRIPSLSPGLRVFKTYGQTEAFRAASLAPEFLADRPRSVGRPFVGVNVYVVRPDGSRAAPDEPGEIVHTGLGTMLGYLGDVEASGKMRANPFRGPEDPHEWAIFTGDLGRLDSEGFLFIEGRRDGMLKVHGNRVYPAEIVTALMRRPGTVDAEVVGVPDESGETVLLAFVVNPTLTDPSEELRRLSDHLPAYMVPRQVILRQAIEKTASGKPDFPILKKLASEAIRS